MPVQACGSNPGNPTAPSIAAPVVRSVSVSPAGAGLENATQFMFSSDTNATAAQSTFA